MKLRFNRLLVLLSALATTSLGDGEATAAEAKGRTEGRRTAERPHESPQQINLQTCQATLQESVSNLHMCQVNLAKYARRLPRRGPADQQDRQQLQRLLLAPEGPQGDQETSRDDLGEAVPKKQIRQVSGLVQAAEKATSATEAAEETVVTKNPAMVMASSASLKAQLKAKDDKIASLMKMVKNLSKKADALTAAHQKIEKQPVSIQSNVKKLMKTPSPTQADGNNEEMVEQELGESKAKLPKKFQSLMEHCKRILEYGRKSSTVRSSSANVIKHRVPQPQITDPKQSPFYIYNWCEYGVEKHCGRHEGNGGNSFYLLPPGGVVTVDGNDPLCGTKRGEGQLGKTQYRIDQVGSRGGHQRTDTWVYDDANRWIKSPHLSSRCGTEQCLEGHGAHVGMADCSTKKEGQRWYYDAETHQLKVGSLGKDERCLEGLPWDHFHSGWSTGHNPRWLPRKQFRGLHFHGKLVMAPCNTKKRGQRWNYVGNWNSGALRWLFQETCRAVQLQNPNHIMVLSDIPTNNLNTPTKVLLRACNTIFQSSAQEYRKDGQKLCALEGQTCKCTGIVKYGIVNQHWHNGFPHRGQLIGKVKTKPANGSIECTNVEFGGDPGFAKDKACVCIKTSAASGGGRQLLGAGPKKRGCWQQCGKDGPCSHCGAGNYCCRKLLKRGGCNGFVGGVLHHECVPKPQEKKVGPAVAAAKSTKTSDPKKLMNAGRNCWFQCNKQSGPCPQFCGTGKCCRKGSGKSGCPLASGGVAAHMCVAGVDLVETIKKKMKTVKAEAQHLKYRVVHKGQKFVRLTQKLIAERKNTIDMCDMSYKGKNTVFSHFVAGRKIPEPLMSWWGKAKCGGCADKLMDQLAALVPREHFFYRWLDKSYHELGTNQLSNTLRVTSVERRAAEFWMARYPLNVVGWMNWMAINLFKHCKSTFRPGEVKRGGMSYRVHGQTYKIMVKMGFNVDTMTSAENDRSVIKSYGFLMKSMYCSKKKTRGGVEIQHCQVKKKCEPTATVKFHQPAIGEPFETRTVWLANDDRSASKATILENLQRQAESRVSFETYKTAADVIQGGCSAF